MSPHSILLLLSACGNLYQGFLLWKSQTRKDAADLPVDCASLCPSNWNLDDMRPGAEPLHLELASSVAQHSIHSPELTSSVAPHELPVQETLPKLSSSLEEQSPRALATSSSTQSSSSHSGAKCAESSHHPHQHDALFFLFNIIVFGTALLHISSVYPNLQFTVMLFMVGMVVSFILEGADLKCSTGIVGQSYMMWMDIDPHLVMFTMLPCLLAGDAMTIDTSIAKRVGMQCLYLAGPGVLISAFLVAAFLKYYLDWSFLLSLVTASILCATDPVAVVALLKELGASPVLTVQIQGESLLNDGTAIVLYTVAYDILSGVTYNEEEIVMFLVKTALLAVAVGAIVGWLFYQWLRAANDRFNHASGVIQILLTLSAAYWSFIMAEGTGAWKMSGVLATVASSLMLAHFMWPHLVSESTLSHFWHCLEELMNIIIFLLAGALCGAAMVHIEPMDYLHLLVIYIVLAVIRAVLIFGSRPLLRCLSKDNMPVSKEDAAVMTWGGLRGAVGLTLAIQVRRSQAANSDGVPQIDEASAERVLFFVSGIAFLTTIVNATTCPLLVQFLGLTALPHVQEQFLMKFTGQLVNISVENDHDQQVTETLEHMLHHVDMDIHAKASRKATNAKVLTAPRILGHRVMKNYRRSSRASRTSLSYKVEGDVRQLFQAARAIFELIPELERERLDHPSWDFADLKADSERMLSLLSEKFVDEDMCKVVNKTFMKIVQSNYQQQLHSGELRPGSRECDILMTSVRVALSPVCVDLTDFDFVNHCMLDAGNAIAEKEQLSGDMQMQYGFLGKSEYLPTRASVVNLNAKAHRTKLERIVQSTTFLIAITVAIVLNAVYVVVDEAVRDSSNEDSPFWLIAEYLFCVIFTVEAGMKLANGIPAYFKVNWNKFDFFLVILGIVGAVIATVEFLSQDSSASTMSKMDNQTRVIRTAKVFRAFRFLRIFRVFQVPRWLRGDQQLALSMQKVQTLTNFVQAHVTAQKQLKRFFVGEFAHADEVEIARCLLQSQAACYKALISIVAVQRDMDEFLMGEIAHTKEVKRIAETLQDFVQAAEEAGAVTSQEAHAILHPMHAEIAHCVKDMKKLDQGQIDKSMEVRIQKQRRASQELAKRLSDQAEQSKAGAKSPRDSTAVATAPPPPEMPAPKLSNIRSLNSQDEDTNDMRFHIEENLLEEVCYEVAKAGSPRELRPFLHSLGSETPRLTPRQNEVAKVIHEAAAGNYEGRGGSLPQGSQMCCSRGADEAGTHEETFGPSRELADDAQ